MKIIEIGKKTVYLIVWLTLFVFYLSAFATLWSLKANWLILVAGYIICVVGATISLLGSSASIKQLEAEAKAGKTNAQYHVSIESRGWIFGRAELNLGRNVLINQVLRRLSQNKSFLISGTVVHPADITSINIYRSMNKIDETLWKNYKEIHNELPKLSENVTREFLADYSPSKSPDPINSVSKKIASNPIIAGLISGIGAGIILAILGFATPSVNITNQFPVEATPNIVLFNSEPVTLVYLESRQKIYGVQENATVDFQFKTTNSTNYAFTVYWVSNGTRILGWSGSGNSSANFYSNLNVTKTGKWIAQLTWNYWSLIYNTTITKDRMVEFEVV